MSSQDTISTIHVGVGRRGLDHLRSAAADPRFSPVAAVDVEASFLAEAERNFGIPAAACLATLDEALRSIDAEAVVISTPARFHGEQIRQALEAGRHVMVEKPFTIDLAEAERLVEEAARRDLRLLVTQQVRYFATNRTLRRLIAEETFGPAGFLSLAQHKYRPTPYPPTPHQQLWQMSVHDFDTLRAVTSSEPQYVYAAETQPPWTRYATAPTVSAVIEFESGVLATYVGSSDSLLTSTELRVDCAEATLIQRGFYDGTLVAQRQGRPERAIDLDPSPSGLDPNPEMFELFYRAVRTGQESDISGGHNLGSMRFVDACVRSAETGARVSV